MQVIFRAGTIVGAVGVVAAMSGYENAMYGLAGMTARMMAFVALTAVCVVADNLPSAPPYKPKDELLKFAFGFVFYQEYMHSILLNFLYTFNM